MALVRAAETQLVCHHDDEASVVLRELLDLIDGLGTRGFQPDALDATALVAHRRGDDARAVQCLGAADAVRNGRAQDTGFVLLGTELARVRAAANAALGENAVLGMMTAAEAGSSAQTIAAMRQWLEGNSAGPDRRPGGPEDPGLRK